MLMLPGIALLLGLLCLLVGVRGRRVGVEPRCGGCGFDLTGLQERGLGTCPECGRSLHAPGTVVTGRRRLRRCALVLAGVMVVLGVGVGAAGRVSANWITYSPSRVLAMYTHWTGHDAALGELIKRLEADELSAATVDVAAAAALEAQADRTRTWNPRWGVFVETASLKKLLSAEQERMYLDRAVTVSSVVSRPSTLTGWRAPVQVQLAVRRGGVRGVSIKNSLTANIKGYESPTTPAPPFLGGGFTLGASRFIGGTEMQGTGVPGGPSPGDPAAPPGDHMLAIDYRWWTFWEGAEPASHELTEAKMPPVSGRWAQGRPLRVGARIEDLVEPPGARRVAPAISISDVGIVMRREAGAPHTTRQLRDGTWERFSSENPAEVAVHVMASQNPSPSAAWGVAAYDVYVVVDGGEEQWLGRTSLAPGGNACVTGVVSIATPRDIRAANVDVVLRPSLEAMLTRADGKEQLANEELVVERSRVVEGYPQLRPDQGQGAGKLSERRFGRRQPPRP